MSYAAWNARSLPAGGDRSPHRDRQRHRRVQRRPTHRAATVRSSGAAGPAHARTSFGVDSSDGAYADRDVPTDAAARNSPREGRPSRADRLRGIGGDSRAGDRATRPMSSGRRRLRRPGGGLRLLRSVQRRSLPGKARAPAHPGRCERARAHRDDDDLGAGRRFLREADRHRALHHPAGRPGQARCVHRTRASSDRVERAAHHPATSDATFSCAPIANATFTRAPTFAATSDASGTAGRDRHRHLLVRAGLGLRSVVSEGCRLLLVVMRVSPRNQQSAPRELRSDLQEYVSKAAQVPGRRMCVPAGDGGRLPLRPLCRERSTVARDVHRKIRERAGAPPPSYAFIGVQPFVFAKLFERRKEG